MKTFIVGAGSDLGVHIDGAHLGPIQLMNDLKGFYQGESFDVTPHFGMRYANFSIDTMNGTATDDINVIEAPIGVTVKGKTTVDGWKVAPAVDVSVVPQFGDKKAKIWNSGVSYTQDVLDPALVRTSVGVTAQKDNFTFGLNYRLGVGANERQNHHFNATVRYQF